jgi:NAD(P)-dependent dehydrogenase (short-subunit alcohol dehydrogenase family)
MQNAGMSSFKTPMEDLSLGHFEQVMRVNVTAPFLCSQLAVKIMKEQNPQGGRYVSVAFFLSSSSSSSSSPSSSSSHPHLILILSSSHPHQSRLWSACRVGDTT